MASKDGIDVQKEMELMSWMFQEKFRTDPYRAVMACFPWGQAGTPLENFSGPRKWQCDELKRLALHIKRNGADGESFSRYSLSVASGRGSGKSAFIGMITWWFRTFVFGGTCVVTANTEAQLRTKTFPEILKWNSMAINSSWWDTTALSIRPAGWYADALKADLGIDAGYYYTQGQLWSEENPDAFAGAHSQAGMMYVYDEASGIVDGIWTVTDGVFTEPILHRYWMVFGNMRRNTGKFYDTQYSPSEKKFWANRTIDSRTVEGVDRKVYEQIIEKSGDADSDEARVEVYGLPPKGKSDSIIPRHFVDAAAKRDVELERSSPIVWGLDPAVDGDRRVMVERQGNTLTWWKKYPPLEPMALCSAIKADYDSSTHRPVAIFVEGCGVGAIYYSRLKQLGLPVFKVTISERNNISPAYFNLRTELIYKVRDWVSQGNTKIPDDEELKRDFTIPRVDYQKQTGLLIAESKDSIRKRGERSYDVLEAMMMTFARENLVDSQARRYGVATEKIQSRVVRCA